ncbi:hypothetical protein K6025_05150 [Ehrlichia sp. JZT12]
MYKLNNTNNDDSLLDEKLAILTVLGIACICLAIYVITVGCCFIPRISRISRLAPDATAVTAPNTKPSMLRTRNTNSTNENHEEDSLLNNIETTDIESWGDIAMHPL